MRGGLILTFGNMHLSIKQQNLKLKRPISRIVMENELQTKHHKKCNLKKSQKAICSQLQQLLPTLPYTTVLHQINLAICSKAKSIVKYHKHKLIKFRQEYTQLDTSCMKVNEHNIHNFSLNVLSLEEITALLSFALDQHIPHHTDNNSINTELELFY